jgi:aspartate beta-hydroxylase
MADETQLNALLGAAENALMQERRGEALELAAQACAAAPDNPDVLSACGILTLRAGNAGEARVLIERAMVLGPRNPRYLLNLAMVLRELRDGEAEMKALDQALALDPYFFAANLQKGSLFEQQGSLKRAAGAYHAALASLRPGLQLPSSLRPLLEHAQQVVQTNFHKLEDLLQDRLAPLRQQYAGEAQDRVDDCVAAFLGKKRIYNAQPTMTHFPRLPAICFFERRDFPWIGAVEAATADMRDELGALLASAPQQFIPYVNHAPQSPLGQWSELNSSQRWSALFLHQDGEAFGDNIARCPRTMAALSQVPLLQIPGRAPTAFFSRLEPRTRIPPHTGSSNTRLTVHIPLIVPQGCGFRVGAEVREWRPGTALIFDDTIEHEAWNDSDQLRVVFIFDVWNPLLTHAERELMTAATAGIAEFFDQAGARRRRRCDLTPASHRRRCSDAARRHESPWCRATYTRGTAPAAPGAAARSAPVRLQVLRSAARRT